MDTATAIRIPTSLGPSTVVDPLDGTRTGAPALDHGLLCGELTVLRSPADVLRAMSEVAMVVHLAGVLARAATILCVPAARVRELHPGRGHDQEPALIHLIRGTQAAAAAAAAVVVLAVGAQFARVQAVEGVGVIAEMIYGTVVRGLPLKILLEMYYIRLRMHLYRFY
jgi:hypothetical protein